jgi:hypothetical protein
VGFSNCKNRQKKTNFAGDIFIAFSIRICCDRPIRGTTKRRVVNILIYVHQNAMLHSLFYVETAVHVSGGITTHNQERKQLYLQHLVFVTPLLLPFAIVEEFQLQPDAVHTVVCAPDDG